MSMTGAKATERPFARRGALAHPPTCLMLAKRKTKQTRDITMLIAIDFELFSIPLQHLYPPRMFDRLLRLHHLAPGVGRREQPTNGRRS